ncbi:carboxypeptidase B2 [Periophthalmus magnuspinnatus]|uniref:carboxypeptidase B2 n=1 Tax=Periophthalmus magnuspinnatus TaxID=409849 RepID=UPI00243696CF|nr:carboxypeptidase B2 [Periophthalmus magnuspinnatus]
MKTSRVLVVVLVLNLVWARTGPQTHDQVLSLTPKSPEHVEVLRNISTQFETSLWQPVSSEFIKAESAVHLFVPVNSSERVREKLRTHGITHEVLLANAEELVEMQTRNDSSDPRSSSTFYERYHSLEDIYLWINRTSQDNSASVKVLLLGSSYEKRPIYALKLSLSPGSDKKALWLDCGIHAREWISPAFCLWFVQYSLGFYGLNSEITQILDSFDVYVLPVLNPDGYRYTWTKNRMWRKNRSVSQNGRCVGVDLNRNFDANWCTEGASSSPCSEIYCGRFPESEPESQAVSNFLRTQKDLVQIYISIHSYSQMLLFPYSCTTEQAPDHQELLEMVKEAAQRIRRHYRNNYKYGAGAETIYLAPGGSDDWAYNLGIKYSFTFELQDTGRYGFLLPPSHISKACNEALLAVKTIALKVLQNRAKIGPNQN